MIDFALDHIGDKTSEADILETVDQDNICKPKNYENNPKIDLKGMKSSLLLSPCEAILSSYEDELIQVLRNRYDIHELESNFTELIQDKNELTHMEVK